MLRLRDADLHLINRLTQSSWVSFENCRDLAFAIYVFNVTHHPSTLDAPSDNKNKPRKRQREPRLMMSLKKVLSGKDAKYRIQWASELQGSTPRSRYTRIRLINPELGQHAFFEEKTVIILQSDRSLTMQTPSPRRIVAMQQACKSQNEVKFISDLLPLTVKLSRSVKFNGEYGMSPPPSTRLAEEHPKPSTTDECIDRDFFDDGILTMTNQDFARTLPPESVIY